MSGTSTVDTILSQAGEREKEYDWLGAAEFYVKALNLVPETDFLKLGQLHERIGYAFYRAAMQAESATEFRGKMNQSVAHYEKAKESYEKLSEHGKTSSTFRCDAMIAYIGYWLASEVPEKKRLLADCWRLTKESLKTFKEADDAWEYGRTYNQFSSSAVFAFCLDWDFRAREKMMKEVEESGEYAIELLSTTKNLEELARAYARTADYLYVLAYMFSSQQDQERRFQKARDYWQKAKALCEETAVLESLSILEGLMLEFAQGAEETRRFYQKALEYGKKTADSFSIGCAFALLAYHTASTLFTTEDPDERIIIGEKALQYAAEARTYYSKISFICPGYGFFWVEEPYPEYYGVMAFNETDLDKRRDFLKKAEEIGPQLLKKAERSGYPYAVSSAHYVMGNILAMLAHMETNIGKKTKLLEEALHHRSENFKVVGQIAPSNYWDNGMALGFISMEKSRLAELASDSEIKRKMLLEAIEDQQASLRLVARGIIPGRYDTAIARQFGYLQYQYGTFLNRAYQLTHNKEYLAKAAEAFEEAADHYRKSELMGSVAGCYWRTAQTYDALNEHLKSAEDFELASDGYNSAAEKIPQLRNLYRDQASYMRAWSEIEKARHYHEKREYGLAKEHFEKAADLHKSLKRWSYLWPNYSAWAQIEDAEELSRKEKSEEAIKAFEHSSKLFAETKKSVQVQLSKIEDNDEKEMAASIVKASGLRKEYCEARIALEEARVLDKKGDHLSSSTKYGAAAEAFEKIFQILESEQERKEFRSMIYLSQAWQKMMFGDAKASPESYLEASALFEQASKESNSEVTGFLALGHSRFCKALEAGTRFADTGDPTLQTVAMQNLEIAAKYYVRAGFQSASEYAQATGFLFEAYLHMDTAKEERDPEKKTKLYLISEKVLQTSAGSFMKAGYPEKREQVLRLLEKVREEKELASSLAEVLHTPSIVSTTSSFNAPTQTLEEAVGSERFEHADIRANLIIQERELRIGEDLTIELELVNAGKSFALLTKITELIPEGFELVGKPDNYRVGDNYLNLKGKRLAPLKTEEVKLVLRPMVRGTFSLKPTVVYLDENGRYKSHEPEPITITVKELGIKGWIKGER